MALTSSHRSGVRSNVLVVGAGIGGLNRRYTIAAEWSDATIVALEASEGPGGQIVTTSSHDYTFEHGPTSLVLRAGDEASAPV